jgi:hypothetical protein
MSNRMKQANVLTHVIYLVFFRKRKTHSLAWHMYWKFPITLVWLKIYVSGDDSASGIKKSMKPTNIQKRLPEVFSKCQSNLYRYLHSVRRRFVFLHLSEHNMSKLLNGFESHLVLANHYNLVSIRPYFTWNWNLAQLFSILTWSGKYVLC